MTDQQQTVRSKSMDDIMALCKRRGFVYQASEIYGGINGFWDYGPLGAQLKKNLRDAWWQDVVMLPCWGRKGPNGDPVRMTPLDTCIIQHPKVWEASGHVAGFNDPMVDDKETKQRFRADKAWVVAFVTQDDMHRMKEFQRRYSTVGDGLNEEMALHEQLDNSAGIQQILESTEALRRIAREFDEATSEIASEMAKACMPSILIAVVGEGEAEAIDNARQKLTKRQRELLGQSKFVAAFTQLDLPKYIPALSPATQKPTLTEPRQFNLMFKTYIGATATEDDIAYLRPETAQGIFANFKNVVDTTRVKVPFGIAQTGKAFRNEVTPRNFTFRSREFEQMEVEFFCPDPEKMDPGERGTPMDWYAFWRDWRMEWWRSIGLKGDNLVLREHEKGELAHYAKATSDIEYRFPFTSPGFGELEGVAYRGNFDLTQHQQHSNVKLEYLDTDRGETLPNGGKRGERYLPHVIEPSAGLDRGVLALLCEAYTKDESRPSPEIMRFHPRLAPIKAAVFPLVNKDGMPEKAEALHADLVRRFGRQGFIETDAKQSIGKRYARMDEAGCPYCFTIDGQTLTDGTVTARDRDTGGQERISIEQVGEFLAGKIGG